MSVASLQPVRLNVVLALVMLAGFTAAVEGTIVATAMPQIVARLGDFSLYSWVFAGFLMTQAASMLVFGKLADLYGRKPVILAGSGLFLLGSLLCGFAWSMPALVGFRLMQGVGAGSILPVAMTILGDLYPGEKRAAVQGWLSSTWALAALSGPLLGGIIVEQASWPWVFWINVPICLVVMVGFQLYFHETVEPRRRSVDAGGAALFTLAVAALFFVITESEKLAWSDPLMVGALALFAAAMPLFVWQERRAPEPMLAFHLWTHRVLATANLQAAIGGMMLIGMTALLPVYVQGVLGGSAIVAGFTLTVFSIGWPVASVVGGRVIRRLDARNTMRLGGVVYVVSSLFILGLTPTTSPVFIGFCTFFMGFGMGLMNLVCILLIQGAVQWNERASATASYLFARMLGSAIGVTFLGAIVNAVLRRGTTSGGPAIDINNVPELLRSAGRLLPGEAEAQRLALFDALNAAFHAMFVLAALICLTAFMFPIVRMNASGDKGVGRP